jgi:hypothetical protein
MASRSDVWMDASTEQQPRLQLSLDCVQHENYATSIAAHAGTGGWNDGAEQRQLGPGLGADGICSHGR